MDLYAQRLSPNGQALWYVNGTPVSVSDGTQGLYGLELVSDGAEGAVAAFSYDGPDHRCSPGGYPSDCNIYAQRMNDQLAIIPTRAFLPVVMRR